MDSVALVDFVALLAAAGKVYVGSWPVLDGETLDDYLRRILGPPDGDRRPQILGLRGHEFGVLPEQIAHRWYEHQRGQQAYAK